MKQAKRKVNIIHIAIAAIIAALALFVMSLALTVTSARYVSEVGGNGDLPYDIQNSFDVKSQTDLYNAISSGYGYIRLSDALNGQPIIMTGEELELINNLTIDLNGQRIQRNSRDSLLSVPEGKTLTVIDTHKNMVGGMYNPTGSVLTVGNAKTNKGGTLNVYAGMYESGPRPSEYYSNIYPSKDENKKDTQGVGHGAIQGRTALYCTDVMAMQFNADGTPKKDSKGKYVYAQDTAPIFQAVSDNGKYASSNIYFDKAVTVDGFDIPRDSYWYVVVSDSSDEKTSFNPNDAYCVYSYYVKPDGNYASIDGTLPSGLPTDTQLRKVNVFGFKNDIAASIEYANNIEPGESIAKDQYAAIALHGGTLNIDVVSEKIEGGTVSADARVQARTVRQSGSFYSYFGTWQTSCIYITSGIMNVNTKGEIATVNPAELPAFVDNGVNDPSTDTNLNCAKYSEGACIFSRDISDVKNNVIVKGGELNIKDMESATSYNGSVVSVSGGSVTIRKANIIKRATRSHADSPFDIRDKDGNKVEEDNGTGTGTEFPTNRQYRDAAVFVNGGELTISSSDTRIDREGNVSIEVFKNLVEDSEYRTTFGILSRGRSAGMESSFTGTGVDIRMHGSYSYGIFGTRGNITLTGGSITCDSDNSCYGIYATNKTKNENNLVNITLVNSNIEIKNKRVTTGEDDTPDTLSQKLTYQGADPTADDTIEAKDLQWALPNSTPKADVIPWIVSGTKRMRAASIGVYLDSSDFKANEGTDKEKGGSVTLDHTEVFSQELGVAVNGGTLTFKNGGGVSAYNGSAVYLNDGNILFGKQEASGANYDINSYINRKASDPSEWFISASETDKVEAPGLHQYGIFMPWDYNYNADTDTVTATEYVNENGIHVEGGSLDAYDKLTMIFRGLYNDVSGFGTDGMFTGGKNGDNNFQNVIIKSFAVACVKPETAASATPQADNSGASVYIENADITSRVGGGVKVSGGTIVLGKANGGNGSVRVTTEGYKRVHGESNATYHATADYTKGDEWKFYPNLSGGHAVIARDGELTVNCGTYIATFGNGAAVSHDTGADPTNVTINGGTFTGMTLDNNKKGNAPTFGGPMSYYGVHVLGSSDVTINDGTFTGKNGGAYFRGTDNTNIATVKVSAGVFGDGEDPKDADGNSLADATTGIVSGYGQDGINTGEYCKVYLGTKTASADRSNDIKVYANLFPISINACETDGSRFVFNWNTTKPYYGTYGKVYIYIYYGTYYIRHKTRGPYMSALPETNRLAIAAIDDAIREATFYIYGIDKSTITTGWNPDKLPSTSTTWHHVSRVRYNGGNSVEYTDEGAGTKGPNVKRANGTDIKSYDFEGAPTSTTTSA